MFVYIKIGSSLHNYCFTPHSQPMSLHQHATNYNSRTHAHMELTWNTQIDDHR